MKIVENDKVSFKARVFWLSKNSRNFAKDYPELKNILKHHMGGDDVTHYVQYDNDIFILSSSKEMNRFQTNSYTTGKVGCSTDEIKAIFREHLKKFRTLGKIPNPKITIETEVVKKNEKSRLKSFLKSIFKKKIPDKY